MNIGGTDSQVSKQGWGSKIPGDQPKRGRNPGNFAKGGRSLRVTGTDPSNFTANLI